MTSHQYARLASPPDPLAAETGRQGYEVMLAKRKAAGEGVEGGPGGAGDGEEDVA